MRMVLSKVGLFMIAFLMPIIAGCGSGGTSGASNYAAPILKPGELRVSKKDSSQAPAFNNQKSSTFSNSSSESNEPSITTFDLGTIKASRDFYFIVYNPGDITVTDVAITSNNSNFTVTPNSVYSIAPQKDLATPIVIRVSAIHGQVLDGVGYTSKFLNQGTNKCSITVTGKTRDQNNNTKDVSLVIDLLVYAELFDISMKDDTDEIDLSNPTGLWTIPGFAISDVPGYKCTKKPIIQNTGNVDITVTSYANTVYPGHETSSWYVLEQFTLKPSESKELIYPIFNSIYREAVIKLEGNNTIADYKKLRLKPDGTAYIEVENWF